MANKRRKIFDVNPQWLAFRFVPAVPGTTETFTVALPQNRLLQPRPNEAVVIEFLKVQWYLPGFPDIDDVDETSFFVGEFLTTRNHGTTSVNLSTPDLIDAVVREMQGAFTAGGTYAFHCDRIVTHDLTDSNGNGVVVATDNVYVQLLGGSTYAQTCEGRLLYRFRTVPLAEFIGMVQSQQ